MEPAGFFAVQVYNPLCWEFDESINSKLVFFPNVVVDTPFGSVMSCGP